MDNIEPLAPQAYCPSERFFEVSYFTTSPLEVLTMTVGYLATDQLITRGQAATQRRSSARPDMQR